MLSRKPTTAWSTHKALNMGEGRASRCRTPAAAFQETGNARCSIMALLNHNQVLVAMQEQTLAASLLLESADPYTGVAHGISACRIRIGPKKDQKEV
eukprot:scaffold162493_cov15-Tisochrysis_lutea.AAC.1